MVSCEGLCLFELMVAIRSSITIWHREGSRQNWDKFPDLLALVRMVYSARFIDHLWLANRWIQTVKEY